MVLTNTTARQAKFGFGSDLSDGEVGALDDRMRLTLMKQLVDQYGWDGISASAYVSSFLEGQRSAKIAQNLDQKYELQSKTVLELGSGLGSLLLALRRRDISVVGIEPSPEWCNITHRRLICDGRNASVIRAYGEALPFPTNHFDFIISMQVVEHVSNPPLVLKEVHRVLRPGGVCFLACPNYFSFRENHYRVLWFPGLPKALGAFYLRLRGRNPQFYQDHVNNITFRKVISLSKRIGFENLSLTALQNKFRNPRSVRSKGKRLLSYVMRPFGMATGTLAYWAMNVLKDEITYVFRKV